MIAQSDNPGQPEKKALEEELHTDILETVREFKQKARTAAQSEWQEDWLEKRKALERRARALGFDPKALLEKAWKS